MAAGRLWIAGLGMFLLARSWGMLGWGRWFSGLVYPFCGFLIVWLLYPVTPVAIWLPWLLLATDRALARPRARSVGLLALAVGLVLAGGHIQTSAHVLLAAGLLALWRTASARAQRAECRRGVVAWVMGIALGIALGAAQIVPLGFYLAKSPVWGDRQREAKEWWALSRPRLLDAVCTALPYAYGSQQRGHPNLARALGIHNLNESAGGYAGLATLIWLVPLGVRTRHDHSEVWFLIGLLLIGAMGAFRLPPVDNVLRALPVLEVTDNRRLSLWVALALVLLGGYGMDGLARGERIPRSWIALWVAGCVLLGSIAVSSSSFEPLLRARATKHYQAAAAKTADLTTPRYSTRAERQVRTALEFLPRYYGLAAVELLILSAMAALTRSHAPASRWAAPSLLALTLVELTGFGLGLNPAISPELQDFEPSVMTELRRGLEPGQRAIGIGEELPPNVLMRFGLEDPRNYDSVELGRSLRWFSPLYEPGSDAQTSRRQVTWEGVARASERLREASVAAIVGATRPAPDHFARVEKCGEVWIAWLDPLGWVSSDSASTVLAVRRGPNSIAIDVSSTAAGRVLIRETWDPGWHAKVDGKSAAVSLEKDTFATVVVPSGNHVLELEYNPIEVRIGLACSGLALFAVILALTGLGRS
jgi:hypothetical protein